MLSKYSSAVGGVTRIFMSASQTEMHTLSVVSFLVSGKLTDGCMHSRPLAVKRSEFVKILTCVSTAQARTKRLSVFSAQFGLQHFK